ncbi:hypothetical protein ABZX92_01455 [Lentzea sp. NPDC006480]|uniref:hypothetical protein n=1 Tax=Lentzea sp. NPDC006480 TaxID=3157176 RepID=UPI0033BB60F4
MADADGANVPTLQAIGLDFGIEVPEVKPDRNRREAAMTQPKLGYGLKRNPRWNATEPHRRVSAQPTK